MKRVKSFIIILISTLGFSLTPVLMSQDKALSFLISKNFSNIRNELTELFGFEPDKKVFIKKLESDFLKPWVGSARCSEYECFIYVKLGRDSEKILRHELMHVYLTIWSRRNDASVPLWVHEGLAGWFERIPGKISFPVFLKPVDPISFSDYPSKESILKSFYFSCAHFFFFLDKRVHLKENFRKLLEVVKSEKSWERAIGDLLKEDFETFHKRWFSHIKLTSFLISFGAIFGIVIGVFIIVMSLILEEEKMEKEIDT